MPHKALTWSRRLSLPHVCYWSKQAMWPSTSLMALGVFSAMVDRGKSGERKNYE